MTDHSLAVAALQDRARANSNSIRSARAALERAQKAFEDAQDAVAFLEGLEAQYSDSINVLEKDSDPVVHDEVVPDE